MSARRTVRAILIDDEQRLVLRRRVRPGQPPYRVKPGGGVEPSDRDPESALHRELLEELGATIEIRSRVAITDIRANTGAADDVFFLARLTSMDAARRTGGPAPSSGTRPAVRTTSNGPTCAAMN